jgi:hypothetical protein
MNPGKSAYENVADKILTVLFIFVLFFKRKTNIIVRLINLASIILSSLFNAIESPAAQFSENRGEYITIACVRGFSINYIVMQ